MKKVILPFILWVSTISVNAQYTITLHCLDMTPHVGQKFEMRVVDKATHEEVGRNMIAAIPSAEFSLAVSGAKAGESYMVDFFADFNGNGLYDAPPADHAWRLEVDNLKGDTTLDFTHNTNFTDIMWPYLLTFNVATLQPHIGEMFAIRVYEQESGKEIYRTHVSALPADTTTYKILGIVPGMSYNIDFFADHNSNGTYDPPPTDHAWRIALDNVQGDTTILFTHNTNFTDIKWPYLLTFNVATLQPHIGEMFAIRVYNQESGKEIYRTYVPALPADTTTYKILGIVPGMSYNIDFFADHNKNGVYDPPPTDHAWRIALDNVMGDTTILFTHNTNFTDIMWKYMLNLNFKEFYPHIGNKFVLWVKEQPANNIVADSTINAIDTAFFSMSFPVMVADSSYHVDFYADFNGNGQYDPPPTDHAWRIVIDNVMGDTTINFTHNTSFTDISGQATGIKEISGRNGYEIYPNPSAGEFRLSLQKNFTGRAEVNIFNTSGKLVSNYIFNSSDEIESHRFNLGAINNGVYLLQLKTSGSVESIPLILKR